MQCPSLYVSKRFAVCKLAAGQRHQAERCRLWEYFWEGKKKIITIISKSTYCHHLYSKLQTPTLIPNWAKVKPLEIAKNTLTLQIQFAYVVRGSSCRYLTCQMDFQMSYQRKRSQYSLFFKRKGSKGNLIRIYVRSVSSQHNCGHITALPLLCGWLTRSTRQHCLEMLGSRAGNKNLTEHSMAPGRTSTGTACGWHGFHLQSRSGCPRREPLGPAAHMMGRSWGFSEFTEGTDDFTVWAGLAISLCPVGKLLSVRAVFLARLRCCGKRGSLSIPARYSPASGTVRFLSARPFGSWVLSSCKHKIWTSCVPGRALRTPHVPSCEGRASQVLQNLTMPSNLRTHLCIQAENKHKKDSQVSCEATGMSVTLRDQQYHTLQSGEVLAYPTGNAVPSLTGAVMTSASIPFILTSHTEQQHNFLDSSRLFLSRCISNRKRKRNILIN